MTLTQISTAGVKDDAVTAGKIPANAVGSSELADNAVDTAAIAADAVTAAKLASNAVVNASVDASAAIAGTKISPDFGSQNIVTTGSITGNDLEIDSGTLSVDASNNRVGIGTTSPSAALEVVGGTGVNVLLNATTHDASTANQARLQLGFVHSGGQALGHLKLDEAGNNSFDGLLKLGVPYNNGSGGSSTREIIEADFNGNICFPGSTTTFDTTARTNGLQLYYETDSGIATLGSYSSGGSTELNFHTNSGGGASAERMRIDSSGNVGIGTTNPTGMFAVSDGSVTGEINPSGGICYIGTRSNHPVTFLTNASGRMTIDSSGKVGIGASSPNVFSSAANNLVVETSSGSCGITISTSAADQDGAIFFAEGSGSNADGRIKYEHSNNAMYFSTDNNERLRIDSSGVVQLANKTITGGNNNAIQNIKCLGTWSGSGSIGKTIELISGYDGNTKMAALSYNLTDISSGGTYGGDLNLHSQPLYSSPTTPIPIGLKIKSNGCVQLPKNPSFRVDLNNSQNNTQLASGTRKLSYTLGHTLDQVRWDVGSNYTPGNSRFTCPVDGTYVFHLYMGGHASSGSQGFVGMEIYINGTRYNGAWNSQDAGYQVSERIWTLKLSDGDYVEMGYELENNNGWRVIGSTGVTKRYTGFEGYLVG